MSNLVTWPTKTPQEKKLGFNTMKIIMVHENGFNMVELQVPKLSRVLQYFVHNSILRFPYIHKTYLLFAVCAHPTILRKYFF